MGYAAPFVAIACISFDTPVGGRPDGLRASVLQAAFDGLHDDGLQGECCDAEDAISLTQLNVTDLRRAPAAAPKLGLRRRAGSLPSPYATDHPSQDELRLVLVPVQNGNDMGAADLLLVWPILGVMFVALICCFLNDSTGARDARRSEEAALNRRGGESLASVPADGVCYGTSAVPTVPSDASKEEKHQERLCVVCMGECIDTAALPCQHSTMCSPCMSQVRRTSGRCPLCRAHIDYAMHGHFEADFVDFAPGIVAAAADRASEVRAVAYESMYDNVRGFIIFGILSAGGAAFSFYAGIVALGIGLAVVAVVLGYIPWFSVTVAAFEREGTRSSAAGQALLSREDFGRPHVLFFKLILLVFVVPLALVFFFVPYFVLVLLVKPIARCAYYVGMTWTLRVFILIGCYSYMYFFRPIGVGASMVAEAVGRCVAWLCMACWSGLLAIYINVLLPFAWWVYDGACAVLMWVVSGAYYIARVAQDAFEQVLVPMGRASLAFGEAVGNWIHEWISEPFANRVLIPFGNVLADCIEMFFDVVVFVGVSVGSGLRLVAEDLRTFIAAIWRGIRAMAWAVKTYFFAPLLGCFRSALSAFYEHVILRVARGLNHFASAMHSYILAPIGRAVYRGCTAVAMALYDCIILPLWQLTCWVTALVWRGISATAAVAYNDVCVPIAQAVASVARAVGIAVQDAWHAVVQTCGAISAWLRQLWADIAGIFAG